MLEEHKVLTLCTISGNITVTASSFNVNIFMVSYVHVNNILFDIYVYFRKSSY